MCLCRLAADRDARLQNRVRYTRLGTPGQISYIYSAHASRDTQVVFGQTAPNESPDWTFAESQDAVQSSLLITEYRTGIWPYQGS